MDALDNLGIHWQGLLAQAVNFLLLLGLLWLVAYKPVLRMLDRRATRIRESMERAEEIRREAARTEEQFAATLARARKEGQAIMAQASEVAERIRAEAQEEARRQAEEFLSKARAEIQRDKERAAAELRAQVADLAILAASKVVKRSLDDADHYRLVTEVLAETERLGDN